MSERERAEDAALVHAIRHHAQVRQTGISLPHSDTVRLARLLRREAPAAEPDAHEGLIGKLHNDRAYLGKLYDSTDPQRQYICVVLAHLDDVLAALRAPERAAERVQKIGDLILRSFSYDAWCSFVDAVAARDRASPTLLARLNDVGDLIHEASASNAAARPEPTQENEK